MKKLNYLALFLLTSLIGILVSSCSKEEIQGDLTKAAMMVKNWKMTSQAPIDLLDCQKDDVWDFKADGTYTINVGSDICFAETNQSGEWQLSTDGKLLTLKNGAIVTRYEVVSVSLTQLVLKMTIGDLGLQEITFT